MLSRRNSSQSLSQCPFRLRAKGKATKLQNVGVVRDDGTETRDGLLNRISSEGWEHRATSALKPVSEREGFSRHMGIKRSR